MTLEGKNVIVIGGTSGIGASIVEKLVEAKANMYNVSRSESNNNDVTNIKLDITTDFDKIEDLPDSIDGLVYCPGSINLKPFQSLSIDDFQNDFEINVLGAVKVLKACLKGLKKSGSASVVMYSTVAVTQGMNFHSSIATSKAGVEGLVKSLAAEWSRNGIRVNAIAPSLTDTPMAGNLLSSEDKRKASSDRHPLKRVGTSDEMADASVFLLSEKSGWMTGQILHIDGGLSSVRPI